MQKKIFILIDVHEISKDAVVKDLQEEGYQHDFFFGNFHDYETTKEYLVSADEVWCFGDCKDLVYYKLARELGADIWQMK